jgi:adenine-specific DNA-methyltransferase
LRQDYPTFRSELLGSDEARAGESFVDSAISGTLIHGRTSKSWRCSPTDTVPRLTWSIFDPPYNTSENTFKYKNSYKHSSWAAMMLNRLEMTAELIARDRGD